MSPDAKRDWRLYAEDIIEACGRVRKDVAGMTFEAFVLTSARRTRPTATTRMDEIEAAARKLLGRLSGA